MIRREARKAVTRAVEYDSFSHGKKGKGRWRIQPQTIQTACCRKVWAPSSPYSVCMPKALVRSR